MSERDSSAKSESISETRRYHTLYLRAINNPFRRKILRVLKDDPSTIEELHHIMGLAKNTLEWHLNILENGFCVKREDKEGRMIYKLTKEGEVVDFME